MTAHTVEYALVRGKLGSCHRRMVKSRLPLTASVGVGVAVILWVAAVEPGLGAG